MFNPDRFALDFAALDGEGRTARRAVCRALKDGFEEVGGLLHVSGHIFGDGRVNGTSPFGNGDDSLVAVGYLSQTASSLIGGAADLLEQANRYAASALIRQLVEVEYLHWAFAEDHDEAAAWLRSSHEDRMKRWQPRHLRERSKGRFRGADYSEHCEVGGHPTPKGVRSLLSSTSRTQTECLYFEAATHGESAWRYLLAAVKTHSDDHGWEPPLPVTDEVAAAVDEWHHHDRIGDVWVTLVRAGAVDE